jgi:tetratricopeptide (TPR) repeat protein
MKFFTSILLVYFVFSFKCHSQNRIVDSLKNQLSVHTQEDTIRVILLNQLASEETYNHPMEAGNYALEARTLAEKINYPNGVALSYRFMGNAFWAQANQTAALDNFLRGLKIADSIQARQIQADLTGNLGMVSDLGDYPKALFYYRASLDKQRELKNKLREAVMNINIGNGHYHLNHFDSALYYYQNGIKMMRPIKNVKSLIDLGTIGVGDAYAGLGNYDEALRYYYKAKKSTDSTGHSRGRAHARFSLANLFIKKKKYDLAEKELIECLSIAKTVNLKTYVRDSYELLSKVTELQGRTGSSYEYYKQFIAYHDSIKNSAETSKIASLQLEYQLQKKQLEINGLKKDTLLKTEELKFKNTLLLTAIVGIVFVALFLISTARNHRNQKKLNTLLGDRNAEITRQQIKLSNQHDKLRALNEELRAQQEEVILQRDILANKNQSIENLNKQIIEINQNLEKIVMQRTASLQEQNKKLEEYAFINAHKLRAPVASILGLVYLLQKGASPVDEKMMIGLLRKASDELDKVIHSISDMLQQGLVAYVEQNEEKQNGKS